MSVLAGPSSADILELPSTWLARLVRHVASGAGGLASAAALSETCKSFYALSESPAVAYRNLHVDKPITSLKHPFFRWLAKRHSRISGLTAELGLRNTLLERVLPRVEGAKPELEQLQVMFGIPRLHLSLRYYLVAPASDDRFITKVLRPYGHLIDHLSSTILFEREGLTLQAFCRAAAACSRLELKAGYCPDEPVNMGVLNLVAGSLVRLHLFSDSYLALIGENVSSLSLL